MDTVDKVRCSELPLAMICAGSVRIPEVQIDPVNDAADEGTAVHFALARLVLGDSPDVALDATPAKFPSVDIEEVRPLFWAGVRMWKQISEWMPSPSAEVGLPLTVVPDDRLTGHVDVDSNSAPKTVQVLDWKSGRKDAVYRDQGFGYAWLEFDDDPDIETVGVHFAWLRTGELESYTVTRARAAEWYSNMIATVINWDGVYHPGDHCINCPRNHACPAQTALVRRDVAMFSDSAAMDLQTMPAPDFVTMHRKLKGLAARAEDALKSMRAEVERRGGEIDPGDGTVLHFREEGGKRKVDPLLAWPILEKTFTEEELCKGLTISVSTLEKIVGDKTEKGKGKAKQAFCEELEKAGALTQPRIKKLIDERKKD